MNNGLGGWPTGRLLGREASQFGWPQRRQQYRHRPEISVNDMTGTSGGPATQNMLVYLPSNLAIGDYCVISLKCSANNTPGTPTGWTALQAGAQGSTGNITLIKLIDGSEGDSVIVTSGTAALYSALANRITGAGPYTAGSANSASGATPIISAAGISGVLGQMPVLALGVGTGLFQPTLANYPASGIFANMQYGWGSKSPTIWESIQSNNDQTRVTWVVWAYINQTFINQYLGVGTWTNFTHIQLLFPPPVHFPSTISR